MLALIKPATSSEAAAGGMGLPDAEGIPTDILQTIAREMNLSESTFVQRAQAIGANTREATTDLGSLRAEVEASLRKVEQLVNDLERRWPFKRDPELKLP